MFTEESKNGIVFMKSDLIGAVHGFSTRFGGVSRGDYASMNFGSNRGDEPEAVAENYARWCEAVFGKGKNDACVTKQVHGNVVRIVTENDCHECMSTVPYEADGLVTGKKGLPIFCFTADCVPVLLWDAKGRAAAAVHCGWKSSVADILGNAVQSMEALGAEAGDIRAALGPAIGRCCFETDADVPEAISRWLGGDAAGLWDEAPGGKFMVDLRAANAERLIQLGLSAKNIDVSGECTFCSHDKYYSARYTGRHGQQRGSLCAGIML